MDFFSTLAMNIPLNQFENYIDETILKRGLDYFNAGAISDVVELSHNHFEGLVVGSDNYTVNIELSNGLISRHTCDCPYDMGPICKHVVAVIFYLQQDELDLKKKPAKKKTPVKKRSKSIATQVNDILDELTHEELRAFVKERCNNDSNFRNLFLAAHFHLSVDTSREHFQTQISRIIKSATDRDGWVDRNGMRYIHSALEPLLTISENFSENQNLEGLFNFSTALLEEMIKALNHVDDSNGDIGGYIYTAMEMFSGLCEVELPESLRSTILTYCHSRYDQKIFSGWDEHQGMMRIASRIAINVNEADKIIESLNQKCEEYLKNSNQELILNLIRKFKSKKEVEDFIQANLSNYEIRKNVIEEEFKAGNYERVVQLANEGVKLNEKTFTGLVSLWKSWLLHVALVRKDTDEIIKYAKDLFIEQYRQELDYYQILVEHTPVEKRGAFIEELILEIDSSKSHRKKDLREKIFIREQMWDRLMESFRKNPHLDHIQYYEKYLAQDYSQEIIEIYDTSIRTYLQNNVGRTHYKKSCKYMRRMVKLGGNDTVVELKKFLKTTYFNRPALLQELDKM